MFSIKVSILLKVVKVSTVFIRSVRESMKMINLGLTKICQVKSKVPLPVPRWTFGKVKIFLLKSGRILV